MPGTWSMKIVTSAKPRQKSMLFGALMPLRPWPDFGARNFRPERERGKDSDRETGPAAAGGDGVGVFELEGRAHEVVDEIEARALDEIQRERVDSQPRLLVAEYQVAVLGGGGDVEVVLEAGTTAAIDRNAQHRAWGFVAQDFRDAAQGALGSFNACWREISHLRLRFELVKLKIVLRAPRSMREAKISPRDVLDLALL